MKFNSLKTSFKEKVYIKESSMWVFKNGIPESTTEWERVKLPGSREEEEEEEEWRE